MAKAIKRVGVIFLAVAIICLMAIGVILGVNGAKSETAGSLNLNNEIENVSETSEVEIPPISEEVLLDGGNCTEQAAKWTEAITKSLANDGGNHILVTLTKDWVAPNSGNHNFGEGVGFSNGRIFIPENAVVTLDLNGKKIDRALTSAIADGSVIFVEKGTLIIKDSCFDYAKVVNAYNADPATELSTFTTGAITGGYSTSNGGGIHLSNAKLIFDSGMIYKNFAASEGGAIYNMLSHLTINRALINNNFAGNLGGGVFAEADVNDLSNKNVVTNINGAIFHKNTGQKQGGGAIRSYYGDLIISDGIFSYNVGAGTRSEGGAIYSTNTKVTMTGGLFEYNTATLCGGGIRIGGPEGIANIENIIVRHNSGVSYGGGIRFSNDLIELCTIKNSVITNNSAINFGGGIAVQRSIIIGAGLQVYYNKVGEAEDNLFLADTMKIKVAEKLLQNGVGTHIRVTIPGDGSFTDGYTSSGNTMNPNRFFYSDIRKNVVLNSSGEVEINKQVVAQNSTEIVWGWGRSYSQMTRGTQVTLPHNANEPYEIINNIDDVINESGVRATSHRIQQPGKYVFYTDDVRIQNPTFTVIIEEPIAKLTIPTIKNYVYIYDGQYKTFVPENFNSATMKIDYNFKKDLGKYTAKVSLKNGVKSTWSDGTTDSIEYQFEIIHPGVVLKDNSNFDYIYKDSNNLRQSYKANKIIHKVSESETTSNYVIGNIAPKTTIKQFVGDIRKECGYIKIYNGNTLLYDGITETDASESVYVATGYRLELYKNSNGTELLDTVYLSVLGDVVANGVIDTADVTFISRIVNEEIKLETLSIEQQLAAMVDNKGKVTSTDGKILLNVIGGNTEVDNYFENVTQKDDYQILVLNSTSGKTYRQNMNLTTLNVYDNAIIGNIAPNTKASEFKTKLATQTSANISDITIHKANGAIANDNDYIGTGYYISYAGKTIYLSVLGDLTGDGEVNTMDVTCLNRIISGNVKLNTNDIKDKLIMLSALIQNKGNLTTADSETLLNYIGGNADMNKYY